MMFCLMFSAKICNEALPGIHAQYAQLQPTFNQIDRLQELVETAQRDTDAIGKLQILDAPLAYVGWHHSSFLV